MENSYSNHRRYNYYSTNDPTVSPVLNLVREVNRHQPHLPVLNHPANNHPHHQDLTPPPRTQLPIHLRHHQIPLRRTTLSGTEPQHKCHQKQHLLQGE